jgi:BirA family biotin operon repressor/biotin-[acetyl-CoA-carboxylase] ligase
MYSIDELQCKLNTQVFGKNLFIYESIDSTNACAKKLAGTGAPEGTVVIADYQSAGRGRLGRTWHGEAGKNLLFSIIIRPVIDISKVGLLPLFAAVGVALTIKGLTDLDCECKWPNDILLNERKCCGILMESAFQQNTLSHVIIGIGLNVNQKSFGEELDGKATSLRRECGKEFDRGDIFQSLMTSFESLYTEVKKGDFNKTLRLWKLHTSIFGKQISLTQAGKGINGRVIDLADNGGLIIETATGSQVFYAGDVTLSKHN